MLCRASLAMESGLPPLFAKDKRRKAITSGIGRAAPFALVLILGGCAGYQPFPLATAPVAPDPALSALALKIDRPYLTPQPINLSAPLSPNALAIIAVLEQPDLKALRARAGVVEAQAFAAGLLPDPSLQAGADKVLSGPDVLLGLSGQLGFDLSSLRQRAAQRAKDAALIGQVRGDIAWAEWQTACNARLQGARVVALGAQIPLAQASAIATQSLYDRTARAALRGDIARADTEARRLSALDAAIGLRALERDFAAARLELNRMLGLRPETVLALANAEAVVPVPPAATLVDLAFARRYDLAALRKGYDANDADVRIAVVQQFPTLNLNLVSARDTAGNHTAGGQIGFTLPLWNRNRGGIAIAEATRAQLHAEYDARLFQTRADIWAATSALQVIGAQHALLAAQLPALGKSAVAATQAAARGDISLATSELAAQAYRDRQLVVVQLGQMMSEQLIALELLTGSPRNGWIQ